LLPNAHKKADCDAFDNTMTADVSDEEPMSATRTKKKKEYADFITGLLFIKVLHVLYTHVLHHYILVCLHKWFLGCC